MTQFLNFDVRCTAYICQHFQAAKMYFAVAGRSWWMDACACANAKCGKSVFTAAVYWPIRAQKSGYVKPRWRLRSIWSESKTQRGRATGIELACCCVYRRGIKIVRGLSRSVSRSNDFWRLFAWALSEISVQINCVSVQPEWLRHIRLRISVKGRCPSAQPAKFDVSIPKKDLFTWSDLYFNSILYASYLCKTNPDWIDTIFWCRQDRWQDGSE